MADKGQIPGIGRKVNSCYATSPGVLELRLRNYFKAIDFSVGQDNASRASDQILMVRIIGNGTQIDIKRVPFNKVQTFSLPVKDVNALQIQFFLDEKTANCGHASVNAVLYDAKLTS